MHIPTFEETKRRVDLQFAERREVLRDHFAGQALAGICSLPDSDGLARASAKAGLSPQALIARTSYEISDAMLAEREKRKEAK